MFWGDMIYRAGAGPKPIPFKELTEEKLVRGIKELLGDDVRRAAGELSERMAGERGVEKAVEGFYRLLPLKRMRCAVFPERVAVWEVPETKVRLSSLAAGVLDKERKLDLRKLQLCRHKRWDTENQQVSSYCTKLTIVGSSHRIYCSSNRIWCRFRPIFGSTPRQSTRWSRETSHLSAESNR